MKQYSYEYGRKCFACDKAMHDMQVAFHFQDGSEYCSDRCARNHSEWPPSQPVHITWVRE